MTTGSRCRTTWRGGRRKNLNAGHNMLEEALQLSHLAQFDCKQERSLVHAKRNDNQESNSADG